MDISRLCLIPSFYSGCNYRSMYHRMGTLYGRTRSYQVPRTHGTVLFNTREQEMRKNMGNSPYPNPMDKTIPAYVGK